MSASEIEIVEFHSNKQNSKKLGRGLLFVLTQSIKGSKFIVNMQRLTTYSPATWNYR